ncbi:hypothetical protein PN499_22500 [Kamptonema animale CS-326]|nr:hypothetical protein [Kamptonema animale]MDB9513974.1 hypothetical protein [Kamptonema animale CS-326]
MLYFIGKIGEELGKINNAIGYVLVIDIFGYQELEGHRDRKLPASKTWLP